MNQGKWLIVAMISVGLAAGGITWWYQYRQSVRVIELWSPEVTYQIRMAPECQLLRLTSTPTGEGIGVLDIDGAIWGITQVQDISKAAGIVHARQALIHDASYDWTAAPPATSSGGWTEAIRFQEGAQQTTLLFDLEQGIVRNQADQQTSRITPLIRAGLRTFFDEQWADDSSASPATARP